MPEEAQIEEKYLNSEPVRYQLKLISPDKVVQTIIPLRKHIPVRNSVIQSSLSTFSKLSKIWKPVQLFQSYSVFKSNK